MAKIEFRENYEGAAAKPLAWEKFIEILDVIWGNDIHSRLNIAGGIQACFFDKNNVKYEVEYLKEIEEAYKSADTQSILITHFSTVLCNPNAETILHYKLPRKFMSLDIKSIDKEIVDRATAIVKKHFPHEIKISEPQSKEDYVHSSRIIELKSIESNNFDLTKLIKYCEELNITYSNDCYFSVLMLVRSIINHVPPIFNVTSFKEVLSQHGGKSFKDSMKNLENSSRKIADSYLHEQIRNTEVLPNSNQVKFIQELDVLLSEVVRVLK